MDAFEAWNEIDQLFQRDRALEFPECGSYEDDGAPDFSVLREYEETVRLLSIAILLRDRRSIIRIIYVLRSHRGRDGLFEQLIGGYVKDEMALDVCVIAEPYDILLQVFYEDGERATLDLLRKYLKLRRSRLSPRGA